MVRMSTKCQRPGCGRKIWAEDSERAGYGGRCLVRVHLAERLAARTEDFKLAQVEKAIELIEDGAIVPAPTPGLFWCVSSDGAAYYLTDADWCSCPASGLCYHQVATAILTAA